MASSGWHVGMALLSLGFLIEMLLVFRELWWWKQATAQQMIWVNDWEAERGKYLHWLGSLFCDRFFKYVWAVAFLGFGFTTALWRYCHRLFGINGESEAMEETGLHPIKETAEGNKPIYQVTAPTTPVILTPPPETKRKRAAALFFGLFCLILFVITPLISELLSSLLFGGQHTEVFGWESLASGLGNVLLASLCIYALSMPMYERPKTWLASIGGMAMVFSLAGNLVFWLLTPKLSNRLPAEGFAGIYRLARALGFPLHRLFLSESLKGNAYASGLGRLAHIVIGSDLPSLMSPLQLTAVVAHELGHWRYEHVALHLLLMLGGFLLLLAAFWLIFNRPQWSLVRVEKGHEATSRLAQTLCLLLLLLIPIGSILLQPLYNLASWLMELAADRHAGRLGFARPLMLALVRLAETSLGRSINSPMFAIFYATHPPHNLRLAQLAKFK